MRCPACGYDLVAPDATTCPSCGQPLPREGVSRPLYGSMPPDGGMAQPPYGTAPQNQPWSGGLYSVPGYGYSPPPPASMAPPSTPWGPASLSPWGAPAYPPPSPPPPARKRTLAIVLGSILAALAVVGCTGLAVVLAPRVHVPLVSGTSASSPHGDVIYENSFETNAAGWTDNQYCFLGPGGYHVHNRACAAPIGVQTDLDITVQITQISGPTVYSYGIMLRGSGPDKRYDVGLDSNSSWVFSRCDSQNAGGSAHCTRVVDYTHSDAIRGGLNTTNTLEV